MDRLQSKKHKTQSDRRRKKKDRLIDMHGGKCVDCSGVFESYVYDFHHLDESQKSFELGNSNMNRSWESLVKEAAKCVLLCSNCHRKRHYYEIEMYP